MNVRRFTDHASQWMRDGGPLGDVVISSRVRLARNLAGFPFLNKASDAQRGELTRIAHEKLLASDLADRMLWVDLCDSPELDRQLLVERHLISRQHSEANHPRGLAVSVDESVAVMVNEEDHLRLQVIQAGMRLGDVFERINAIDDRLENELAFAYSPRFGYLTACPTNVGSGIRVSVMLHLPALKLTGEIDKVKRAARDLHLAVRGFYGEGTESVGDFFQVSNQTTLGKSEAEILSDFQDQIIPRIIGYEHAAREALAERRSDVLEDRIHRAWGLLTHARMLGGEEAFALLSHLRMGVSMGRLNQVNMNLINELFLLTQPAHLQKMARQVLNGDERRAYRARFIRDRLLAADPEHAERSP